MTTFEFPSVETADESGLLAVGGDLEVDSLLLAYRSGIFPWPVSEDAPITWFAPSQRAVVFLKDFHITRSLQKLRERNNYTFTVDKNFSAVIQTCASPTNRSCKNGTWITEEMLRAYLAFHQAGYCHSVECYNGNELIGGLYGVAIGGFFGGESMFFRVDNASKLCVCYLVDYLKKQGVTWFDCQQMTPLFNRFGAVEVSRAKFMKMLEEAIGTDIVLFS